MASGRLLTVQDIRQQERLVDAASRDEATLSADIQTVQYEMEEALRRVDQVEKWMAEVGKRYRAAQTLARREREVLNKMIERYHAQREK